MVKQGYKQTEIGVIPEDWEVKVLREVSSKITDGTHDTPKPVENGIPYLTAIHVKENFIDYENCYYLPESVHKTIYTRCNPEKGDLLMVNIGAGVGNSGLNIVDYEFSLKNVALIKPNKTLLGGQFLNQWQIFNRDWILKNIITGGAQPFLSLNQIGNLPIPLPPLREQEAIAEALSDADAWIASLEQIIAKKRLIKQGAMQELLTPKEDWIKYDFNKVVWFQEGPGLRNWQFTKDGIKVINVTNLENGYLNLAKTSRHISWNEFEKMYKHFEIDEGDIVVASSGNSYGKVSVVRKQDLPLVMNTSVIRFKPSDKIGYQYLLVFLKSFLFKNQIDLLITGGAQPNFGPAHLNKIKIYSPKSLSEQTRIATILSDMDAEIEALEQKLSKARQIKQGMMQELLTGRIRLV